ncbi:tetratricopeptide repeat protein [Psychrobacter immobilis]|uniref:tetratricopeptide repeat protein n=1 Tax=Psychrobacter immobilis TaxID=498 RepID=UPI00191B6275|nr:tetratricopeptide repeat protein [Psychrobacter immobilis]
MMFFGSLFQSQFRSHLRLPLAHADKSRLRALLQVVLERLCQHYRLTLSLAVCLCLVTPAHANQPDDLLEANVSEVSTALKNENDKDIDKNTQPIENVANVDGLAPTSLWQPEHSEPSLYALLDAEFSADRGDKIRAVTIYKQQSFKEDATAVFERALSLSLRTERVEDSLHFAKSWQDHNPDHVPAWFYVAHLALRAHDYLLAGETLNRILRYDPRADLSEILIGIYPNDDEDKRELLAALQPLDSEQNASLSVLKAGLLYQFNEPETALVHINRALERQPDYVPFITLKADIMRKIVTAKTVVKYLDQARLRNSDSKSLYLYEIRYLLDLKQSQEAWQLLLKAHDRFNDDEEITLLAALVSLDIEKYDSADQLLNMLAKSPSYLDQAYYYLGISAERQKRFEQAKYYFNGVMQEDLVLEARRKVVDFEMLDNNVDAAIATLEKLRKDFTVFAPDTFVLQADILWQQNEPEEALRLLTRAARKYPDNEALLFARAQLLDDQKDYIVKRTLLNHLQALDPTNLSYQLSYAQLLLANERSSEQGLALATAIIQIRYDDPRYDNDLHLQALNVLASNALANEDYKQVINYLQTPYDVFPTLRSGTLLLRAYQGLGDNARVETLLTDLQQRFSFGQHNINDRIQLY